MLDTAGSDEMKSLVNDHKIRESQAYIVVIDLTSATSIANLDSHYRRIYGYHPRRDVSVILVGNKSDG